MTNRFCHDTWCNKCTSLCRPINKCETRYKTHWCTGSCPHNRSYLGDTDKNLNNKRRLENNDDINKEINSKRSVIDIIFGMSNITNN